jgi:MFS family permease
VFFVNVTGQFFGPARFATVADVVPTEADRAKAAGLGQLIQAAAVILGPPIAAPLLFTVGLQWALLLNALSYVFSYFAVRSVALPDTSGGPRTAESNLRREFVEGLRVFRRVRVLAVLLFLIMISGLSTGAINTLDVFFVTENLHAKPSLYGLMGAVFGAGYIVGAVLSGRAARKLGAGPLTAWSFLAAGLVFVLYARQTMFVPALAFYFAIGVPVALLNAGINPMLMAAIPGEFTGRVIAIIDPAMQLATVISTTVSAWLASTVLLGFHGDVGGLHIGRIDTIFAGSALLLVVAGGYAFITLPKRNAVGSEATEPGEGEAVAVAH